MTSTDTTPSSNDSLLQIGKDIVRKFAMSAEMTLPLAEKALEEALGTKFVTVEWAPALKAVMDAEGDVDVAMQAIDKLEAALRSHITTADLGERSDGSCRISSVSQKAV